MSTGRQEMSTGRQEMSTGRQEPFTGQGQGGGQGSMDKVMSVLQSIQNLPASSDDMADFSPLPPPTSAGVQATILKEQSRQPGEKQSSSTALSSNLQSNYYSNLEDSISPPQGNDDYYKRFIPNYNEMYKSAGIEATPQSYTLQQSPSSMSSSSSENTLLIDKLNYMIHLLEEQQDERTNNVTEEVILYSFLGIFIIFVVDSFARVGKYTR